MTDNTISFDAVLDDGISGPLAGITRRFRGLVSVGRNVSRALAPLSSQFTQIATAIIGVEGARRAINAAGAQAKAEQQILAALKGNTEELTKIVDLTKEIQSRAVFNDADLLASANTLLQMGVNTENLERGLQASVETASALGLTLESTTKSFGLIESAGLAGELGERIPFLRELIADGKSFAEITDVVLDRFGGIAEAAVDGPFGRFQIQIDATTDILERFGNEIIVVVNPAIESLNSALTSAANVVSGPEFKAFFSLLSEVVPIIGPIVGLIASLGAATIAIKAISFSLSGIFTIVISLVSAAGTLLTTIGAVPIAIALVLQRVGALQGIFSALSDAANNLANTILGDGISNIKEALSLLRDGKADVEDVASLVRGELAQFGLRFESAVIVPIKQGLIAIKDFSLALVDLVVVSLKGGFLVAVNTLLSGVTGVLSLLNIDLGIDDFSKDIQEGIDSSIVSANDALSRIALAFNVGEKIKEDRQEIESQLAEIEKATDSLRGNLEANRVRTLEGDLIKFSAQARSEIEALSNEFETVLGSTFTFGEGTRIDTEDLFENLSPQSITNALSTVSGEVRDQLTTGFEQAINQLETLDKASANEVANLRIALLDKVNQVRIDTLSSEDAQQEGSIAALKERLSLLDEEKTRIETTLETTKERLEIMKESGASLTTQAIFIERITQLTEILRNKEAEGLQIINSVARAEQELNDLRAQSALSAQAQIEVVTQVAQSESEKVKEAFEALNAERESIADRFSTGVLTRSGVVEAEQNAIEEFNRIATSVDSQLTALIARFPEAASNIEVLRSSLERTREVAGSDTENGSLFDGAIRGARAATAEFQDLGLQGERIGSTLILSFGNGLTDALFEGGKSLKQFTADFLIQIAKMIAQLIIFRALSSAFNFSGGATGATDGVGATGPVPLPGSVPGFNQGGRVPGPNVNRDVVAAMLTPGEQVVDRDTAAFYGAAFFERMKKRLIPKGPISGAASVSPTQYLNSGGRAVSQNGGGSSSSPSLAVILPDAQSLERQLSAGTPALLEWMQEHGFRQDGFDR